MKATRAKTHVAFVKITTLNHEILDDTVKSRTLVTESLLA